MIIFTLICFVFLILFILPIFVALRVAKHITKPLYINQHYIKDPRYFSNSFKKKLTNALKNHTSSNTIELSKKEPFINTRKNRLLANSLVEAVVYASEKNFIPKPNIIFKKEVYVKHNAILKNIPEIRAISCLENLTIGSGLVIKRWADANGMVNINNNCNLGISTTSGTKLTIGKQCSFRRLYAPQIDIVPAYTQPNPANHTASIVSNELIYHIKYVNDLIVNSSGILNKSIISKHDIIVLDDYQVQGHISCHKDIKLNSNVRIHGNLIAEGNIYISNNAVVNGVVFAQGSIYIDNNVVIGQPFKIKSVVARNNITFGENCRVYGYVSAEGKGYVSP